MSVSCLFPKPMQATISGLYLDLKLHDRAEKGNVLIYSNYIASLDGRISLRENRSGEFSVPSSIANKRDWRLYQELAAQADVMLTSARYFRQLDQGCAQDLLPVGMAPDYADLSLWRQHHGLKPQPDVMIISASLDIPLQAIESLQDRVVHVLTTASASVQKRRQLEAIGVQVWVVGEQQVDGNQLKSKLIELGYRSAYMIAGPAVHHTLLSAGVLNRLFLTTHLSLLGCNDFHTILQGSMVPIRASLRSLYLDGDGTQMFAQYDIGSENDS
ncbi:MAG: dihydrofolate reductase family protein [Mariprofundaceae bacterium]